MPETKCHKTQSLVDIQNNLSFTLGYRNKTKFTPKSTEKTSLWLSRGWQWW